jgi:hypothetical protein
MLDVIADMPQPRLYLTTLGSALYTSVLRGTGAVGTRRKIALASFVQVVDMQKQPWLPMCKCPHAGAQITDTAVHVCDALQPVNKYVCDMP